MCACVLFIFVILMITLSVLESNYVFEHDIQRGSIVALRCVIYGLSMTSLPYKYMRDMFKANCRKETINITHVPLPAYLGDWQESASLVLTVCLVLMFAMLPILWCWGINVEEEVCSRTIATRSTP